MPNIQSAKKRVDVIAKKTLENKMVVSRMKTAIKKYNAALAANDFELAKVLLPQTVSVIDAACSDGVIHRNNASRKVSQLNVNFQKAKAAFDSAPKAEPVVEVKEEVAAATEEKPKKKAAAKKAEAAAEEKPVKKAAAKKADKPEGEAKPAAKKAATKKAE